MKYVIRRNIALCGLLFEVYEKKTKRLVYRVEGSVGGRTLGSEFHIYSSDGSSEGRVYESGRPTYGGGAVTRVSGYDYAYSVSLGDFNCILQGSAAFLGGRFRAVGTPFHADSFLTYFYGICEGKREVATLRISLANYVVNIKDETISRDVLFAIVFGLIALENKHSRNR